MRGWGGWLTPQPQLLAELEKHSLRKGLEELQALTTAELIDEARAVFAVALNPELV